MKMNREKNFYIDSDITRKKYENFFKGKTVAMVSGDPHILGSDSGELIDSHDIVVRMNQGYFATESKHKDIGKRTDVLYTSLSSYHGCGPDMNIKALRDIFKWISCSRASALNRISNFQKNVNKKRIPFHITDHGFKDELREKLGFVNTVHNPTTGMTAIYDILKYDIKELYVTGFTFYKFLPGEENDPFYYREYVSDYRPELYMYRGAGRSGYKGKKKYRKISKQHPPEVEFQLFKKMCLEDDRIKYDNFLSILLDLEG